MRSTYEVIVRPVISEKAAALAEIGGRYVFQVANKAGKQEIRCAVETLFKVKVSAVRTMMVHGKVKRMGRATVKRSNWKKAIITLAAGQKIDLFQTQ